MDIYTRYGGGPLGGPTYRTEGVTEDYIARRDAILDMPLPGDLTGTEAPAIAHGRGIFPEQTAPSPTLREYQATRADAFGRAFTEDNLFAAIPNYFAKEMRFSEDSYPPDPEFNLNDHRYVYELVSPEFYDEINKAKSVDELVARTQYFGKISKDLNRLDELGAEGVAYRAAAFLADAPAYVALGLIGGGLKVAQAGRIANFARSVEGTYMGRALTAGVVEGGFEGLKLAVAPHSRDEVDMLLAIGLGGAIGGIFRPAAYGRDVQEALMKPVKEIANETVATGGRLTAPESTLRTIDKLQVNVASVLRQSSSPTLSSFGDDMFLDVTQRMATTTKAAEVQTAVIDGIQSEFNRRFRPLYDEYLEATGRTSFGSRYRITAQDDFYELVGQIANQPNKNWDDMLPPELVSKIKQANREMGEAAYDILARNKHDMFTSGEIKRGEYLPRRWNRARLLEDINTGVITKADAEKLFETGIRNAVREAGLEIAEEKAAEAGKKFVKTLTKPQLRAGQAGFILEDNAFRSAFDDIAKMLDLGDDEYKMFQEALQRRREGRGITEGTTSATKRRGDIDLEAEYINADGQAYKLSDYVENNVQTLWQSYGRQMGGDTALRAMGINSRAELGALRDKVVSELTDASGQLSSAAQRDLANFDAVIGDMLNISGKFDPESSLWRGTRIVNNLTRASKLGSTWFAMSAELAQVVHTNGIVNTFKSVPVLKQMVKQLKGGKASELLEEIQGFYGLADEILQMPSAARYDDVLTGTGAKQTRLGIAEAVSDRAAEAAYMMGGTKSGTSALEALFAAGANNKLVKLAQKTRLSGHDKWYLEQMGFQGDDVGRLMDAIRTSGSPDSKYVLRLSQWEDQDLAMKLAYGVRRVSHIAIQRGNIGDQLGRWTIGGTLAKDNVLGSMALNLRNYMTTAWNKQFSRMAGQIGRGGQERWEAFRNIVYQGVIVGGLGYMSKNGIDYATGAIDEDTFDERMTPQAIAANTFNMTTFASFAPIGLDFAAQTITGKGLSGKAVRGGDFSLLGASGSYINDALKAPGTAFKALDSDRELTGYDVRRTLGLLPLSSMLGVKQAIGALSQEIEND